MYSAIDNDSVGLSELGKAEYLEGWKRRAGSGMTISPFILLICLDDALCGTHRIDAFQNHPPEHLGQDITFFIKQTSISHTISLFLFLFFGVFANKPLNHQFLGWWILEVQSQEAEY